MPYETESDLFREAYARELAAVAERGPGLAERDRALAPVRRRNPATGLLPAWLGAAAALAVAASSLVAPASDEASLSTLITRSWPADAETWIANFAASAGEAFRAGAAKAPRSSP